jgi:hypothetical protein
VAKPKTARANPALQMALIRQIHVYISVFVAPSLLFFAFTGALQTFRIPDQKTAPVVIQKLARLHKDDVFAVKPPRPDRPKGGGHEKAGHEGGDHDKAAGPGKPGEGEPPAKASTQAMKWFAAAVSVGVIFSTLFGLWMALAYNRRKLVVWVLLAAGVAAPVVIAAL